MGESEKAKPKPQPRVRRTAVLFVHGQGEQTPMTDVLELVDSVWRTHPRAAAGELAEVYSAPAYDHDRADQRRIVTQVVNGEQVDFYQFYWADLMEGNRFSHLWRWFKDLMRRTPEEVPEPLWPLRQITMVIALATGIWGVLFAVVQVHPPREVAWTLAGLAALISLAMCINAALKRPRPADKDATERGSRVALVIAVLVVAAALLYCAITYPSTGPGIAAAATGLALAVGVAIATGKPPRIWDRPTRWSSGAGWLLALLALAVIFLGFSLGAHEWAVARGTNAREFAEAILLILIGFTLPTLLFPQRRAAAFSLGLTLIAAGLALGLVPGQPVHIAERVPPWPYDLLRVDPAGAKAAVATITGAAVVGVGLLLWRLAGSFLVPVMTDSARMFSGSPVNVPNQDRIRERGMRLLKQLHEPDLERGYDRIVVLAHSLGTVVAYRLLAHYWGSVYHQLDLTGTTAAAGSVEKAAAELATHPDAQHVGAWREAVRGYWAALNARGKQPSPWRISDFVTVGSPLTYASLLMENSDREFKQQVQLYKRYPSSPPQLRTANGKIFEGLWPHHSAMFAATCWTNLYFPHRGVVNGDIIGGKLAGPVEEARLGRGVLDVSLEHDKTVAGFTHNEYWRWPDHALLEVRPDPSGVLHPPPHVAALRDALRLFNDPPALADARLASPAKSYPSQPLTPAPHPQPTRRK